MKRSGLVWSRFAAAWVAAVLGVLALGVPTASARPGDQRAVEEALNAWDVVEAARILAELNADGAHEPRNLFLTGHLHLLRGDYEQAVAHLEQANLAGPNPTVEHYLALARSTREQTRDYVEHTTADGNFVIAHAPGVDAVLVPLAEEGLTKAWRELTRIFDFTPAAPIRVEIYPTVDVLGAVSPLTVAEIRTSGTIALCKYNRLMITSPRDLVYGYDWLDTLSHEFIHLLITQKSRNSVPIWLHEGLAKYYEGKWREGVVPKLERHSEALLAQAVAGDTLISFEEMSPSMAKLPSQEATATAFAEVFTVIEFLNRRHGGDVAAVLVAAMGAGRSDREAVSDVAGLPWDRFERTWRGYLKSQNYKGRDADYDRRLLFKGKHSEADELAQLEVQQARDHVWLGDRMRLKDRWKAAAKQYRRAVEYVGDRSPLVQGKLGLALLRIGLLDEAATELQKPIAEHPRHVVLQVYLGEALVKMGRFEEARVHLENVLTINPFDRDVHQNLAIVYDRLGEPERAANARRAHALVNGS